MPTKPSRRQRTRLQTRVVRRAIVETETVTTVVAQSKEAVDAARLRYVSDNDPGLSRRRRGTGFQYLSPTRRPVRDKKVLKRIAALVIPPAWTDVWICVDPDGHIQATGLDARRRKQYRYHPRWRQVRDAAKYDRMIDFAESLPRIREQVNKDLARPGLPRERVLAAVVRLLETTLIRVGNEEYADSNKSFGLTTLRNRHVDVTGSKIVFEFRGKSGIEHEIDLRDERLARIVRQCQDLPGQELFGYVDDAGEPRDVRSTDVNAYLKEISGEDFTAKDFRTWAGTVLAAETFAALERATSETALKRQVAEAISEVATRLGNTRAVCRKCYIHPAIIEAFTGARLTIRIRRSVRSRVTTRLSPQESAVLRFLKRVRKKAS